MENLYPSQYRFSIPKLKGVEPDKAFRDERYKAITLNERNISRCSFWCLTFVDNFHKILWDFVRLFLLRRNLVLRTFWCVAGIRYYGLIYVQVRPLKVVTKRLRRERMECCNVEYHLASGSSVLKVEECYYI